MTFDTPCQEWNGPISSLGYGRVFLTTNGRRTTTTAHRAAWIGKHGPIPEGMNVCHRCDNRKCVNVDHLFLGTQMDNMKDMQAKGRQNYGHGARPYSRPVADIKEAVRSGLDYRGLMEKFSVSRDSAFRWIKKFQHQ
jgi:hypothetical protein